MRYLIYLSAFFLIVACTSSYVNEANKAYKKAQTETDPGQKRLLKKRAYQMYYEAAKSKPDAVTGEVKDRYAEMILERLSLHLSEGSSNLAIIPALMADMDSLLASGGVEDQLAQQYAQFCIQMADSSYANDRLSEALEFMQQAASVAPNAIELNETQQDLINQAVSIALQRAQDLYEAGKAEKNEREVIRAEYYAIKAMMLDSSNDTVQQVLSDIRKYNRNVLSAFEAVFDPLPEDTAMFDKINDQRILIAVTDTRARGNSYQVKAQLYNNSYNPVRLKPEYFYLVDENGEKYMALSSGASFSKDLLAQKHQAEVTVSFPRPSAKVKMFGYLYEDHNGEKYFF